jgi:hypothetical protein
VINSIETVNIEEALVACERELYLLVSVNIRIHCDLVDCVGVLDQTTLHDKTRL